MNTIVEKYGTVNTVANFAKAHDIDVTEAMFVVSCLKDQKVPGAMLVYRSAADWPWRAKNEARDIANMNWGEVYGK